MPAKPVKILPTYEARNIITNAMDTCHRAHGWLRDVTDVAAHLALEADARCAADAAGYARAAAKSTLEAYNAYQMMCTWERTIVLRLRDIERMGDATIIDMRAESKQLDHAERGFQRRLGEAKQFCRQARDRMPGDGARQAEDA